MNNRITKYMLYILVVASLGSGAAWLGYRGYHYLHTAPFITSLQVQHVYIIGRTQTKPAHIEHITQPLINQPILHLSLRNIQQQLISALNTDRIIVKRVLPHTLIIAIDERIPVAIWQNENQHFLLDKEGQILTMQAYALPQSVKLPLILGSQAPLHLSHLLQTLQTQATLYSEVKIAQFVGNRRWDLYFHNQTKLLLPEKNFEDSWTQFAHLNKKFGLLDKSLEYIDLRVPYRMIIKARETKEETVTIEQET